MVFVVGIFPSPAVKFQACCFITSDSEHVTRETIVCRCQRIINREQFIESSPETTPTSNGVRLTIFAQYFIYYLPEPLFRFMVRD